MQWQFPFLENVILSMGVDEAGRGPLFGRVYAAAVVLPREFETAACAANIQIKDSKKFSSKTKIARAAEFIQANALHWSVAFEEAAVVDEINIRQANFRAVHKCISSILEQARICAGDIHKVIVYMDGNDFVPYSQWDAANEKMTQTQFQTVVKGDSVYAAIACASILAKVSRDNYIAALVAIDPSLDERYGLLTNVGYGTKRHMEGIREFGITEHHRKTFIHQN